METDRCRLRRSVPSRTATRVVALFSLFLLIPAASLVATEGAQAAHLTGSAPTYTSDTDFLEGRLINLVAADGELRLSERVSGLEFIWVAVSGKGTAVKIDTSSGLVVGEYLTSPEGMGRDPSRTTVDKNGNVWVSNRAEFGSLPASEELCARSTTGDLEPCRVSGSSGSIVHIGLQENGQCEDRNGNGRIDTSRGVNDVRAWTNVDGGDSDGGTDTAADECIIHYVRVNSTGTRHLSVDANNDVWVSGTGERDFDLVDGTTGRILRREPSVGCGGYGGLMSPDGVIWSARPLLRWMPVAEDGTPIPLVSGNYTCYSHDSYGLGIDPSGNVWNTALSGNLVRKFGPDGSLLGSFAHGHSNAQGVVADRNGDIWVAHSFLSGTSNSVGHLRNDGTFLGNITTSTGPTGVAVDSAGKVWATNYSAQTVSRIDPALNGGVGAVDLETRALGGVLYNYSDMTGSTLIGAPSRGTWTVIHDSGIAGNEWDYITWNAEVASDGSLTVQAASSADGVSFSAAETVDHGSPLSLPPGQYLRVVTTFERASTGESPVLFDLTIGRRSAEIATRPAIAEVAYPPPSHEVLFPNLSSTLTDGETGEPLAGREITFYATSILTTTRAAICTATTGSDGIASCGGVSEELAAILGLGYEAEFAGDAYYTGVVAPGSLVRVRAGVP